MKINGSERETLGVIASCPFADRLELAAMSGASRSAVYEAVGGLEDAGLVAHVPHAADLIPPTRRYHLTARGLGALAESEGSTPDDLLRSRPVSVQWLRILMDRLDALAVIYRLASTVAGVAHPVGLRLYRAGPLDAAMTLPGGRTVGIARQGHAADRTGFSRRLWKLRDGPRPGTVLVLVADEVRLRHARKMLPRTVEALFALERDAALAGPEDEVWRPAASGPPADLRNALGQLAPGGELPVEANPSQADLPGDGAPDADRALPILLKPAEKRALDLIYDWPWLLRTELASLMTVSERRASQLVNPLEGFGLVTRPIDGSGRLALTDRGVALLARRDRTSVAVARRRWSVAPVDAEAPCDWRNVSGGRSRSIQMEEDRAVRLFVSGKITEAQLDLQRKFITERLESARAKLDEYRDLEESGTEKRRQMEEVLAWARKFGQGLEELTPQERHDYLQMLVEQVTIDKDNKVHIAMAFPIDDDSPDPDSPDPEPLQPESMSIGSAKPWPRASPWDWRCPRC